MVIPQHQSRSLYWSGSSGMATVLAMHLTLRKAPRLMGKHVAQIDYTPVVGVRMVMEDAPPFAWRTLTPAECAWIDGRLEAMRDAGLAVWE